MGIFYGMVARGEVVLAEFSSTQTNASTIARQIVERMNEAKNDSNSSFSHDRYIFHVKRTDGLTVLCMADDASGSKHLIESFHTIFIKLKFQFLYYLSCFELITFLIGFNGENIPIALEQFSYDKLNKGF